MPTGTLPAEGKNLYERVYKKAKEGTCKGQKDVEACASKVAWGAVKNAGWKQVDGKWTKSTAIQEFSFTIKKASVDPETGIRRWRADTSDIDEDSFGDNMTVGLYDDFLSHIENNDSVPEEFRSDFWKGGMPYISISHYSDQEGSGVPGTIDALFRDGKFLRAKGSFNDTSLGDACWKAICDDLKHFKENGEPKDDPVRVSIGFLDYAHKHKGPNGFLFERESLNDICQECLVELITGKSLGKEFLKGQLVHLALTRVPVNKRTIMEVDRSMTTKKEDAASIVGEELADELDEKAVVGKSEALVVKAKDAEMEDEEMDEEEEGKDKKKKEEKSMQEDIDQIKAALQALSVAVEALATPPVLEEAAEVEEKPVVEETYDLVVALSEALRPTEQRLDMLIAAIREGKSASVNVPQRRSIDPATVRNVQQFDPTKPLPLKEIVRRSVQLGS